MLWNQSDGKKCRGLIFNTYWTLETSFGEKTLFLWLSLYDNLIWNVRKKKERDKKIKNHNTRFFLKKHQDQDQDQVMSRYILSCI